MSETPITDAAWYASESGAGCEPLLKCSLQLERELRESEASAAVMREALLKCKNMVDYEVRKDFNRPSPMKEASDAAESALYTNAGSELLAEVERVRKAAVPICVGPPIIQILAEEGQWQSESGAAVIAADGLFKKDPYKEIESLRRKVAAAEGMAKALVPFTCGAREVYPGEPCEDFGFQQKGTSAKVHAALSAYQEASK